MRHLMLFAAFAVSFFYAAMASASCGFEFEVFDTVPPDGATDVPTNTHIIVFGTAAVGTVELNGVELMTNGYGIYEPDAELPPNTTFAVSVDGIYNFEFATGADATDDEPPAPPEIGDEDLRLFPSTGEPGARDFPDSKCIELARNTGCADEGGSDLYLATAEFDTDAAVGWLIVADGGHPEFNQLWPASCGSPLWSGYYVNGCYDIRAFNDVGRVSAATGYCFDIPEELAESDVAGPGPRDSDTGGCSAAASGSPSGWPGWLLAFAFLVRRQVA